MIAEHLQPGGLTQAAADARYLQLTGGTLSGALTITGFGVNTVGLTINAPAGFNARYIDLKTNSSGSSDFFVDQNGQVLASAAFQVNSAWFMGNGGTGIVGMRDFNQTMQVNWGITASKVFSITSAPSAFQAFNVFDPTNFELFAVDWISSANVCTVGPKAGGTGTLRGMILGALASNPIGFFGTTPVVQPTTTGTTTGFTQGTGTIVMSSSTFTGGIGTSAYTQGDTINALKKLGLMAM